MDGKQLHPIDPRLGVLFGAQRWRQRVRREIRMLLALCVSQVVLDVPSMPVTALQLGNAICCYEDWGDWDWGA
jgi:hypothetical protein